MECAESIIGLESPQRACRDLKSLEKDQPGDYLRLVTCLRDRAVFPFDFATFITLAGQTSDPALDPDADV